MKMPRLLIAGTHSGVGKTTMTLAVLQGLRRAGLTVQPFKAGPDYIDPEFLGRAAGRPCRNLDSWLVPKNRIAELFGSAARGVDLALIEGVMGLYDGIGATGEKSSTAELAKRLRCPVLLVLDASAISRSAAALVLGFKALDPEVRIAGCLVNRVAGEGHYRLVKTAIEKLAGVPVVGWLPREPEIHLPERHLGLVPAAEREGLRKTFVRLQKLSVGKLNLSAIRRIAERAEVLPGSSNPFVLILSKVEGSKHEQTPFTLRQAQGERNRIPIAVAMDEAFHFYYRENLELLEQFGAEIVPFSPLRASRLPKKARALYLGGGFPEVFAPGLSRNRRMRQEIHRAVTAGMPTYAECGGLMYLCRSISDARRRRHPMVGLLPAEVRMTDRLQNFGYQEVQARGANLLARAGEKARGHEFHHSLLNSPPSARQAAYQVRTRQGGGARLEGYAKGSLLASYVHLHFWSQPRWAGRFVTAARDYQPSVR